MAPATFLSAFSIAADGLDSQLLVQKKLEVEVGIWLKSVVLRMHKSSWANKPLERPQSDAAIFFSIWLGDKGLKEQKLFYNIHALKLRQLRGHSITSRDFAAAFRIRFKAFEHLWPNVSVDFGPLTLMEGWEKFNPATLEQDVRALASKFLQIDSIIDELLTKRQSGRS